MFRAKGYFSTQDSKPQGEYVIVSLPFGNWLDADTCLKWMSTLPNFTGGQTEQYGGKNNSGQDNWFVCITDDNDCPMN